MCHYSLGLTHDAAIKLKTLEGFRCLLANVFVT